MQVQILPCLYFVFSQIMACFTLLQGLPHLNNTATIKNLIDNDVDSYLQGYGIAFTLATTYDSRKMMIASHVGCRDWRGLI